MWIGKRTNERSRRTDERKTVRPYFISSCYNQSGTANPIFIYKKNGETNLDNFHLIYFDSPGKVCKLSKYEKILGI